MFRDRDKALEMARKVRRQVYLTNPHDWMIDRLGVREETIVWSRLKQYEGHEWDGTKDPLLEVCRAVAASEWVAVSSAVGMGKTFLGACLMMYFLEMFENSMVVTIAPKAEQLRLHLWKEAHLMFPKFKERQVQSEILTTELKMKPPSSEHAAIGFVAGVGADEVQQSATKAQGFHAEHMLFIVEETPGVAEAVMTAIQNTCTSAHNLIVAFGNPDSKQDTLAKFAKMQNVRHVRISAFDHPNVVTKNPMIVPGAQTIAGLSRLLSKYNSADAPMYRSRARGIAPEQPLEALIRWEWCEAAANRSLEAVREGPPALGVDVANSEAGDLAAVVRGEGSHVMDVHSFPCPNANMLGTDVSTIMKMFRVRPEHVGVDAVGVGAGTVNELLRLGYKVKGLMGGAAPEENVKDRGVRMQEKFQNLRSQMWWQARVDLQFGDESGLVIPMDQELFVNLCTPKFSIVRNGMIAVESKDQLRKRLGRSPDRADAFVYWNWVRARRKQSQYHFGVLVESARRA